LSKSLVPSSNLIPKLGFNISKLQENYTLSNYNDIRDYLSKKETSLITLLENAYDKIKEYFSCDNISLELFHDLDLSESPSLIIRIKTYDEVDSVLECQRNFDEMYWLESLSTTNTKNIIISFDFE
jgi:hypothetical protein